MITTIVIAIVLVLVALPPQSARFDPHILRPRNFLANVRAVAGLHAFVTAQAPRYGDISAPTVIIRVIATPWCRTTCTRSARRHAAGQQAHLA